MLNQIAGKCGGERTKDHASLFGFLVHRVVRPTGGSRNGVRFLRRLGEAGYQKKEGEAETSPLRILFWVRGLLHAHR